MAEYDMVAVQFREASYHFPAEALGGTKEAPKLKPADELLLNWAQEAAGSEPAPKVNVLHDHFGVLTTCLPAGEKAFCSDNVLHHHRLQAAFSANFDSNTPLPEAQDIITGALPTAPINLLHLPKSLDLFELYLIKVAATSDANTQLAAAFQTRHFSARMLTIAEKYASTVSQSRAYKKARLLILSDFKKRPIRPLPQHELAFAGKTYQQYYGVFSAKQIDIATRFLLEEWGTNPLLSDLTAPEKILDIGCGNGIIGDQLLLRYPAAQLVGTDVSMVALASAKQNFDEARAQVQWTDRIDDLAEGPFDLIVTNPPFHDGHRNTIDTSMDLFKQISSVLVKRGYFVVVANRHLGYGSHLRGLFAEVVMAAENRKFVIYRCRQPLG